MLDELSTSHLEEIREQAKQYGGIDGLIRHVQEIEAEQEAKQRAALEAARIREERRHTGHNYVRDGHKVWNTDLDPECPLCEDMRQARQILILAAARVVSESNELQTWEPEYQHGVSRAAVAMAYVMNVGASWASGDDFDSRFECVAEDWDVYADERADDILDETGQAEIMQRYFDYDQWRRDLRHDYDVVEDIPQYSGVLVFSQ